MGMTECTDVLLVVLIRSNREVGIIIQIVLSSKLLDKYFKNPKNLIKHLSNSWSDKMWLQVFNQLKLLHCIYYFVKYKTWSPCVNVKAVHWNNCIQNHPTKQKKKYSGFLKL